MKNSVDPVARRVALVSLLAAWVAWAPPTATVEAGVPPPAFCSQGTFEVGPGSELDFGWSGVAHDMELAAGYGIGFHVLRRCSDDSSVCTINADCANHQCAATCDCETDTSCEIAGPNQRKRCMTTLQECSSNADCPGATPCVAAFGPPIPISFAGTPICLLSVFDGPLSGNADSATGDFSVTMNLRWRIFLGNAVAQPCPRCGNPDSNPKIGEAFTCAGGQFPGAGCTVDAVSPAFGGTSFDCPPSLAANVSGPGLSVRFNELTTGTTTRTAQLACKQLGFTGNPTVPGSNPKCIDKMGPGDPVCSSNADCLRCSGNPALACTSNADCTDVGSCAQAPDQPVSCGFWCQCGFCADSGRPCFEDGDCADGQACEQGTGTVGPSAVPQTKPNDCSGDGYRCGTVQDDRCAITTLGTCSLQAYRDCSKDGDCEPFGAGVCVIEPRPCFESRITRSGTPSPLGSYCAIDRIPCTTNADCTVDTDYCAQSASVPETVALFCSGGSSSIGINATAGVPGPGATKINGLVRFCRCNDDDVGCFDTCGAAPPFCGDAIVQAGEECDSTECCEEDCTLSESGTQCRTASDCVLAATCNGVGTLCPASEVAEAGAACTDDGNQCTDDECDGAGLCVHADNTAPCDDDDECTTQDTCTNGTCVGESEEIPECSTTTLPAPLCGDVDGSGELTASDALTILQAAVGIGYCQPSVCDFTGDGNVTSVDALAVLRAAVDLPSDPQCPLP